MGKWVLEHSNGSSDCTRHQQKPWAACLPCFTYYAACIENASTNAEEHKYIALHTPISSERGGMAGAHPEGCRSHSSPGPASWTLQGQGQPSSLPQEGQVCTWQNRPGKNAEILLECNINCWHQPQVDLGSERSSPNTAALHKANITTRIVNP